MRLQKLSMKALSVLMSVIMLLGICAPVVGAVDLHGHANEEKEEIVYVSIGDSMTNGYGLDGYNGSSGIANYGKNTYSNRFAAWLAGYTGKIEDDQVIFDGSLATVDHRQLAMSGMRAEDLHWVLELDYENEALMQALYEAWDSAEWEDGIGERWYGEWGFTAGDFRTWSDLCDWDFRYADGAAKILATYSKSENKGFFRSSYATDERVQNAVDGLRNDQYFPESKADANKIGGYAYLQIATEFYQQSVKDADIISLALGNTNFGTFMLAEIVDVLGGNTEKFPKRYDIERAFGVADLDPEMEAKVRSLLAQLDVIIEERFGALAGDDPEKLEALNNVIKYCFTSYIVNYIGVVEDILAVNPDVTIIQVALMNAYADNEEEIEETTLGDIVEMMYTPVNAFIAALPAYMQATGEEDYEEATFYYAEADTVECLVAVFGDDYYRENGEFVTYPGLNVTEKMEGNKNSTVRDRFVEYISGDLFRQLNGTSIGAMGPLQRLTVEEVVSYEKMTPAQKMTLAQADKSKAMSCAFYLAFENAIIEAGKGTVTLESLTASAEAVGGNLTIFAGVLTEFRAQIGANGARYLEDVAQYIAPAAEATLEATINDMLTSFGVQVDLDITREQVFAILADTDGSATEAVCKEIADTARNAIVQKVIPVYKKNAINQAFSGVADAFNAYRVPAYVYGEEFAAGFGALNDEQKEAFLMKFAADYDNDFPVLSVVSSAFATGLLNNTDIARAVAVIHSVEEENIAKATESYIDGLLSPVTLYGNLYNKISESMPARLRESASLLCMLLALPETLSTVMKDDPTVSSVLCMTGRVTIGTGIGGHPSEGGHEALFEAIHGSYVNEYSSFDQTVNNVRDFLSEYYDEIYAYVYAEAKKEGLIDRINADLDEAISAIRYAEAWAFGYEEYFRSEAFADELRVVADNAVVTVETLRDLILNADQLDEETYGKAKALLEQLKVNLADLAALLNVVAEDASVYADTVVKPEIVKALAVLNEKLNIVQEKMAALEARVREQLAIAETMIRDFIDLAKERLPGYIGDAKKYLKELFYEFVGNAFYADYYLSGDSFYLAIGDDTLYAEILADRLKLGEDQFGVIGWDEKDSALIAQADLITVGYSESMISGFAADQMLAYVKNYMESVFRGELKGYAEGAVKEFTSNMVPTPDTAFVEMLLTRVNETLNGALDGILDSEPFANAETEALDWEALIGEEYAFYMQTVLARLKEALIKAGVPETYTFKLNTAELLIENSDQLDPSVAGMLIFFEPEQLVSMFGSYAVFTHELPVMDALMFALESYLYSYVKFNVEYAQIVCEINEINSDAKVILLGNYNTFADIGLDISVGGVAFGLDQLPEFGVKDSLIGAIDTVLGALEPMTDKSVANAVFAEIDEWMAQAYAELKSVQGRVTAFDLAEALKAMAPTDEDLAALVGKENVPLAKRLIRVFKFLLKEFGVCDRVMEEVPTVKAIVSDFLMRAGEKTDAAIEASFVQIGLTLDEAHRAADIFSDYVGGARKELIGIQEYINVVYETIRASEIKIKGVSLDPGELLGAPILAHSLFYAATDEDVIFVDISEAETVGTKDSAGAFLLEYLMDRSAANISETGHAYIADRILRALTVICEHGDRDGDHICDYCGETVSACTDGDSDHKCDICGKVLSECVDADKDNVCDICGVNLHECADGDRDHKCDGCGKVLSECADANKDHKCDICGKALSECVDANKDHKCDICSKVLSECADANKDHKCDTCGKGLSECADADRDHKCDTCGKVLSECADVNNDHKCDICGKVLSECADANRDHKCDACGEICSECVDESHDHKCDICGKVISECTYGDWIVTKEATRKEEGERYQACTVCGARVYEVIPALRLSTVAVIAIAVGFVAAFGGAGFAAYWFIFRKKKSA